MKFSLILSILIYSTTILFSQELHYESLLLPDSTWGSEFFEFPIGFAQEIQYKGMEEARFPKGWGNQESDEFWSYVFTWDINLNKVMNAKEVERDLQIYFDGLMKLNHENKGNTEVEKTTAKFFTQKSEDGIYRLTGKIRTLNAFHTQKAMTLNVTVEQRMCTSKEKSVILFRFSPKEFDEPIWGKLNGVMFKDSVCQ